MVFQNNLIAGASAAAGSAVSFDSSLIGNSVQLDGSADFLKRDVDGGGTPNFDSEKCIMACWFQITKIPLSGNMGLMFLGEETASDGGNQSGLFFSYDDSTLEMDLYFYVNGNRATPSMPFRDTAWYHVLASIDLGESSTDKGKLFVNGIEITDYASGQDGRSSFGSGFTNKATQQVGAFAGTAFFNGHIAQAIMLDGKSFQDSSDSLSITDFLDSFTFGTSGSQFVPKSDADIAALASSAGGNSFCLDFSDSTGTDGANLGNDIGSGSKDLTTQSLSATSKSTNSPSKSYSVFSPFASGDQSGIGTFTLSNHNRTVAISNSNTWLKTTMPFVMIGDNIIRAQFTLSTVGNGAVGIQGSFKTNGTYHTAGAAYSGRAAGRGEVLLQADGKALVDGNFASSSYTSALSNGDVVDVIVNLDAGAVYFALNGTLGGSATQSEIEAGTTTNAAAADGGFVRRIAGEVFNFAVAQTNPSGTTITYNSGQTSFSNSYSSITSLVDFSSASLTAPSFQGADFFNVVKYAGTGSSKGVTGTGFRPDLVWIKNRDANDSHVLYDAVRGVEKQIVPNSTDNESSEDQGLTAFGSDGFTIGTSDSINTNTENFIAWQWKANNTSGSSNSNGSLTTTVASSSAGNFSIVKWQQSDPAAAKTLGHGLSAAPELIIVKNLSDDSTNWVVYSEAAGNTNFMYLNTDAAAASSTTYWQDTTPNSTVFSVSNNNESAGSAGDNMIAYCFKSVNGVCKIGTFEGNGDSNGAYVSLGFLSNFILFKSIDSTSDWQIFDSKRAGHNEKNNELQANDNAVEDTSTDYIDILADGFKVRTTADPNVAETYIYLAMADIGGNGTLPPIYGR